MKEKVKIIKKELVSNMELEKYQLLSYGTLVAIYNLYVFKNDYQLNISRIVDSFQNMFTLSQNIEMVDNDILIANAKKIMSKYDKEEDK